MNLPLVAGVASAGFWCSEQGCHPELGRLNGAPDSCALCGSTLDLAWGLG